MNKEQQIEEIANITYDKIKKTFGAKFKDIAEAVYAAGYRKPPEDSVVLSREEHEILVKTAQGKIGNMKATDFLKACISSGVMVEAVSTKEQVKQAVKEFASKIKDKAVDFLYSATVDGHPGFDIHISELCHMIDELLKEYDK